MRWTVNKRSPHAFERNFRASLKYNLRKRRLQAPSVCYIAENRLLDARDVAAIQPIARPLAPM